jgi:AGZA family xanthine/uracil permease-like MFS transporter
MVQIELSSKPDLVSMDKLTGLLYTVDNGKFTDITSIVTFGNGFIVTGVLWAALVYYLIDRKIVPAVITCIVLAALSLFGVIHSINLDGSMYWLGSLPAAHRIIPLEIAGGYILFAVVAIILHALNKGKPVETNH